MADKATPESSLPNTADKERRRSSGAFANLMDKKRNPNNATTETRRQSISEMKLKPGFLGKMWNDFTKGSTGSGSGTKQ